jgi:hypothetical protein
LLPPKAGLSSPEATGEPGQHTGVGTSWASMEGDNRNKTADNASRHTSSPFIVISLKVNATKLDGIGVCSLQVPQ